jgi:hypothetical protein
MHFLESFYARFLSPDRSFDTRQPVPNIPARYFDAFSSLPMP